MVPPRFPVPSAAAPPQSAQDKRHGKGLDDIIIRKDIKSLHLAGVIIPCRQHDDRRPAFFPQDLADCKSVNLRQHQIQQHQVRIASPECLNPFQTVTGTIYCISCILQERPDDVLDSCFVFYNQNVFAITVPPLFGQQCIIQRWSFDGVPRFFIRILNFS